MMYEDRDVCEEREVEDEKPLVVSEEHTSSDDEELRQMALSLADLLRATAVELFKIARKLAFAAHKRSPSPTRLTSRMIACLAFAMVIPISLFLLMMNPNFHTQPTALKAMFETKPAPQNVWKKPENVRIHGFVMYGRPKTASILDCYLRQNLAENGGWLDEVIWISKTDNLESQEWVDEITDEVPGYRKLYVDFGLIPHDLYGAYGKIYELYLSDDPDIIYIKFDDDLVWLGPNAIEEIVTSLIEHPEAYVIIGNLINSAAFGWAQHHTGAIHEYMPENDLPKHVDTASYGPNAWRASALPTYQPDPDKPIHDLEYQPKDEHYPVPIGSQYGPPFKNHRWLPIRRNGTELPHTPIWHTENDAWGWDLFHWQAAVQKHMSLFQNVEDSTLWKYHFANQNDGLWNMRHERGNINFIALWAKDLADRPVNDDEFEITVTVPQETGRWAYIQTRAMAAHMAFESQGQVYNSDVLTRYRAMANELTCSAVGKVLEVPEREGDLYHVYNHTNPYDLKELTE